MACLAIDYALHIDGRQPARHDGDNGIHLLVWLVGAMPWLGAI